MAFDNIIQPEIISIDNNLRLISGKKDQWEKALPWYTNPKVLYYSEGITEGVYDMAVINRMYEALSSIGELYFIEVLEDNQWKPIGDATLSDKNMPIVIGDECYWGKGFGSKIIKVLIERARFIGLGKITIPAIYVYNERSQNLFKSMGFKEISSNNKEKTYELLL